MSENVSEYSFAAWRKCVADALLKLGRPAKAKEIYNALAEAGTCPWGGNTPWASLGSRLYLDIRDNQKSTPFVKISDGLFYLKEGITSTTPTLVLTSLSIPSETSEPEKPSMTFFESALHVLRNYANKQPMHYSKITELALEHNLLTTEGKTPQASMGAMLVTDIRRRESRGETPVFESKGRGYYGLNEWHESPLEREIDKHNDSVKAELLKRIRSIGGREFEELVSLVFKSMGFEEVETTRYVKDEGVDVRGTLKVEEVISINMAIQVKNIAANVQRNSIDALRGCLRTGERGVFVTSSDFSRQARYSAQDISKSGVIDLISGKDFVNLMVAHQIGVMRGRYGILYPCDDVMTIAANTEE